MFQSMREKMIEEQLIARGITDRRVLDAMRTIPRHEFVDPAIKNHAYDDGPLAIGEQQTISQPYIVAYMTESLQLKINHQVLEIGTGSGYQTAVLAELVKYVYSLERFHRLADAAGALLNGLGYTNVDIHIGDGSQGLADMGPYNAIIVTAAAPSVPGPLCTQLDPDGGRMIIPVGTRNAQHLQLVVRNKQRWNVETLFPVRFVPLVGKYGFKPDTGESPTV